MTSRRTLAAVFLLLLFPTASLSATSSDPAPWTEGPVGQDGLPRGEGRHIRILLSVDLPASLRGAQDIPVIHALDLTSTLSAAGYPLDASGRLKGFELDLASFVLVEVDEQGDALRAGQDRFVPVLVLPGGLADSAPFHARDNPVVTLQWTMQGSTESVRFFYVYLDAMHNGEKVEKTIPPAEPAVGPGRGTTVYVPLHRHDGQGEPRSIRITNLQPQETPVTVTSYDTHGHPLPGTRQSLLLPAGVGSTKSLVYPSGYKEASLLVEARDGQGAITGMIAVEAVSRGVWSFTPGTSTMFLPARHGGFVGTEFAETPAQGSTWYAFCPPGDGAPDCQVTLTQGSSTRQATIQPSTFAALPVAAGQEAVAKTQGSPVAIQRAMTDPPAIAHGLTLWPPLDGPLAASQFMGVAYNGGDSGRNAADHLLLLGRQPDSLIRVRDLSGGAEFLSDGLQIGLGLFSDLTQPAWGTRWDRKWVIETDASANPRHKNGPARIWDHSGVGGITVANGYVGPSIQDIASSSALVPLQSPEGGLRYDFVIPPAPGGTSSLGELVIFTPYAGTRVRAQGLSLDGATTLSSSPVSLGPFTQDQYVNLGRSLQESGWWQLTADRPIVAAWIKTGTMPMAGLGLGIVEGANVQVVEADVSGRLIDMETDSLRNAVPGQSVQLEGVVENLGRTITGAGLPDMVEIRVETPPGWPPAQIFPSSQIPLGETGTESASQEITATINVPSNVDTEAGGATVRIIAQSVGEPRLEIKNDVFLNYKLARGVQVTADNQTISLKKTVTDDSHATYFVQVINTGTLATDFDVSLSLPDEAWDLQIACLGEGWECPEEKQGALVGRTPALDQHEAAALRLTAAPVPGAGSSRLITFVLASSASLIEGIKLETSIASESLFHAEVDTPTRHVEPGKETTFDIILHNRAEVADEELIVEVGGLRPEGWPEPAVDVHQPGASEPIPLENLTNNQEVSGQRSGKVGIPAGSSVRLSLTQSVPDDAPPSTMAIDLLTLKSSLDPTAPTQDVQMRVIAKKVHGVAASTSTETLSVVPGLLSQISLVLESRANVDQAIQVDAEVRGAASNGWTFHDSTDSPAPWTIELEPGGDTTAAVTVQPPATAVPGDHAQLVFRITAVGLDEHIVVVDLQIQELAEADIRTADLYLTRGALQNVSLQVANVGNVPLDAVLAWEGIPDEWWEPQPPTLLSVGQTRLLPTGLLIPAHAEERTITAMARVMNDAAQVAQAAVSLHIDQPNLVVELVDVKRAGAQSVYRVHVENIGTGPAHDVQARLVAGDSAVDEVQIRQILPGSSAVANLIGHADGSHRIHVSASHDAQGVVLEAPGPPSANQEAPWIGIYPLMAILYLVFQARRRLQ